MSKARAKGTAFESAIVGYLNDHGFPNAVRTGSADYAAGDIAGTPLVLEAKNQKTMTLAAWVDQAATSGERLRRPSAVIHKRIRKNIEEAYVTMSLKEFTGILKNYEDFLNLSNKVNLLPQTKGEA